MKIISLSAYLFLVTSVLFVSCSEENPRDRLIVDVDDINVDINTKRLDKDLVRIDTVNLKDYYSKMKLHYGGFWHDYISGILRIGHSEDPMIIDNLRFFLRRPYIYDVINAVDSTFGKKDPYKKDITDAFKHLKYYFPQAQTPEIVYSCNFFNYACVALDSVLNIGLDFYLGRDHRIIKMLPVTQFAEFIKEDMDPEYLVVDAMTVWFESHFLGRKNFETMLDAMIYHGKLMYALDAMMPKIPDHVKIKYSVEEMTWCYENQSRVWLTMVDRKLVHSTKVMDFKRYFEDAPFTAGLKSNEAPEKIGIFIGWQIVRDYMASNKDKTLVDLIKMDNNQKILTHYKQGKG